MKRIKIALFITVSAVILYACQKETSIDTTGGTGGSGGTGSGGTVTNELGNWKLVSIRAITSSTQEVNGGGFNLKTITTSDYTTINNAGTVNFNGSKMAATGLTYAVNSTAKAYIYDSGILLDSIEAPFSFNLTPPVNSTSNYTKITTDSIYVEGGVIQSVNADGSVASMPIGYKLKFFSDTMTMTMMYNQVQTETDQGITEKVTNHATSITTLKKM